MLPSLFCQQSQYDSEESSHMTVTVSKLSKDVGKQKLAAEREGLTFTMNNWAVCGWFEIHIHTNLKRKYYCPTETTLDQTVFCLRGLRMTEKNHCKVIYLLLQLGQKKQNSLTHNLPLLRVLNHTDFKSAKMDVRVHPAITAHTSYVRLPFCIPVFRNVIK